MKNLKLFIILVGMTLKGNGQDTSNGKIKESEISFGSFNTMNAGNKVKVSPAVSGYLGDFYFENRYNYEAANSASINVGKRIFKKIKHLEILPMGGLVFGSFRGITAELQASLDYSRWTISTDNQFSYEYTQSGKSLYLNWTVVRYKLTKSFRIGLTTVLDEQAHQHIIFDKGVTAVMLLKDWAIRFYAFNYEIEKRYYWISLRHSIRVILKSK